MHIRKWYSAVFHIIVYKLCHACCCVVKWIWEKNFFMDVITIGRRQRRNRVRNLNSPLYRRERQFDRRGRIQRERQQDSREIGRHFHHYYVIPYYSTVNPPDANNLQQQHIQPMPSAPPHPFHNLMNIHQPPTDYDNIDIDIN